MTWMSSIKEMRYKPRLHVSVNLLTVTLQHIFLNCSLFFSFVRHVEFSGGLPLYTRSQTPVPGSPFPVASFSNISIEPPYVSNWLAFKSDLINLRFNLPPWSLSMLKSKPFK